MAKKYKSFLPYTRSTKYGHKKKVEKAMKCGPSFTLFERPDFSHIFLTFLEKIYKNL